MDENGNSIAPRQAGPEVLALLNDEEFVGFMSMDGLRDESKSGEHFNILRAQTLQSHIISGVHMPLVGTAPCPWKDTTAGNLGIPTLLRQGDQVQRCRSLILPNGDKAEISRYVIYRKDGTSCVGRVEEILVEPGTDAVLGVLIAACRVGPDILPYRLPACTVQLDQHLMIAFKVSDSTALDPVSSLRI